MTALKVQKMTDVTYNSGFRLSLLLIGPAGSGKTTGAMTGPGRKLLIDCDQSKEVLMDRSDVDFIEITEPNLSQPRGMTDLQKLRRDIDAAIRADEFPYDFVVLDSITRAYELAMNLALLTDSQRGPGGAPIGNHYVVQKKYMHEFLEWAIAAPFHFIATVHEEAVRDELVGTVSWQPTVTGKDAPWLPKRFREVYHTFAVPEKDKKTGETTTKFKWRTQPENQRPYLKSSLNTMQKYWGPIIEPNLSALLKKRGVTITPKEATNETSRTPTS